MVALASSGLESVHVDPVRPDEVEVDGRGQAGGARRLRRRGGVVPGKGRDGGDPAEGVDRQHVHRRVRGGRVVVSVLVVPVGGDGEAGDEARRGVDRRRQVVRQPEERREKGHGRRLVGRREVVAPHPLGVEGGEGRVVLRPVVVGVDLIGLARRPVARLGSGHVPEALPREVLLAVGAHDDLGLVGGIPEELALLPCGGVDELLLGRVERRVGAEVPDGVEHAAGRDEGGRRAVGHGGMTSQEADPAGPHRLAGVVDLQVAKPEVPVRQEGLVATALRVGEGQVRALGVVGRGDGSVGVERVPDVHGDGVTIGPLSERDPGSTGIDLAEVGDHRTGGQGRDRDRMDDALGDPRALGVQVGERRGAGGAEHGRRRPAPVVEAVVRPTLRVQPAVDPLDEVAPVVVALRGGQPLRPLRAPGAVGSDRDDLTARVVRRHLDQEARGGGRAAPARPVPVVQDPDHVAAPGLEHGRQVGGLEVLLVGEAEARARVDQVTVHPKLVLVGRGDKGGGSPEATGR